MKTIILLLATSLMISISIIALGCSSDGGNNAQSNPKVMMRMLPEAQSYGEFSYINLEAVRADDLDKVYDQIVKISGFNAMGINPDQVFYYAASDGAALIQGSFDFDNITKVLAEYGYEAQTYEDAELLQSANPDFKEDAFAFLDTLVILGPPQDVKNCILVIKGKQTSLYDDTNYKDMINRLTLGTMMWCEKDAFRYYYTYDGLQISGTSIWKKNQDTMSFEAVLNFQDANAAELSMDQIKFDMKEDESSGWSNIAVTRAGEYVEVTADQPISHVLINVPPEN
ncbi:MAG: hypothetical protein R6U89_01690 [Dehalococcoidia bacterium]